jgi:hypothetical protein
MGLENILTGDDPLPVLLMGLVGYILFSEQIKTVVMGWSTAQRVATLVLIVVLLSAYYSNKQ